MFNFAYGAKQSILQKQFKYVKAVYILLHICDKDNLNE